jgi:hypothetical protein
MSSDLLEIHLKSIDPSTTSLSNRSLVKKTNSSKTKLNTYKSEKKTKNNKSYLGKESQLTI